MNYTLTVSDADLNVLSRGLGKLTLEDALNTFSSIQLQVKAQMTLPEVQVPAETTPAT